MRSTSHRESSASRTAQARVFLLLLAILLYLLLVLPTVSRQGINWDEQTDLDIATTYSSTPRGWIDGSPLDAINVRLPMYAVAVLFELTGRDDLAVARLASTGVGVLTLVGLYLFGARLLGLHKALLACLIVGTSPYFLFFSMTAFSEGDVYIACTTVWLLLVVDRYLEKATLDRAALVGVLLGVALSSKISAMAFLPAVGLMILLRPADPSAAPTRAEGRSRSVRFGFVPVVVAVVFLAWLAMGMSLWHPEPPGWTYYLPTALFRRSVRLLVVTILWLSMLVWASLNRRCAYPRLLSVFFVTLLSGLTFFVIPPVHTTNSKIFFSLWQGFVHDSTGIDWSFMLEAGALHFLVVLIKPSLVIGAGLWLSLGRASTSIRRRPELRWPLAAFFCYFGFLLALPWAQTRYMMPLFPILALFLADASVDLARVNRVVTGFVTTLAVSLLAIDFWLCYPDLGLNGYQWTGARYLAGRSTLGYRSIAHVPSDGIEQVVKWTRDNVQPSDTVLAFLGAPHIVRAVYPDPECRWLDGHEDSHLLEEADYVLTEINTDMDLGSGPGRLQGALFKYPYDRERLEREFTRVFSVKRAFGIEVAAVWRRN